MEHPPFDISDLAELARIRLSESEKSLLQQQLTNALNNAEPLRRADVAELVPTISIAGPDDITREDIPGTSLSPEQALANAPQQAQGQFRVTKIVADA